MARINVKIPDELLARLDIYAKYNYMSRSSVICQSCELFILNPNNKIEEFQEITKKIKDIKEKLK